MKLLILGLFISFSAFAGMFTQKGSIDEFMWAPDKYTTGFEYNIVYYIPKSLKTTKNAKTLVFLHGGGSSTMTRAGSLGVTKRYVENLKSIADELGFVLVAPSGSGLNWGAHTRTMVRDLAGLIRDKLTSGHY